MKRRGYVCWQCGSLRILTLQMQFHSPSRACAGSMYVGSLAFFKHRHIANSLSPHVRGMDLLTLKIGPKSAIRHSR